MARPRSATPPTRGPLDRALRSLSSTGLRRGMAGSNPWIVVGIAATGLRVLRRLARPQPEVLLRTELRPGDAFEIRALRPRR